MRLIKLTHFSMSLIRSLTGSQQLFWLWSVPVEIKNSYTRQVSISLTLSSVFKQQYPGYQRFFSRCSAEDTSGEKTTRTSCVIFGLRPKPREKTSGAERFDLLCSMELDLVSNLSIKPAVSYGDHMPFKPFASLITCLLSSLSNQSV